MMKWLVALALVSAGGSLVPAASGLIPVYKIEGSSMMPTLLSGDHVIAVSPGNGRSLPVGRIVVYQRPNTEGTSDIKRIVGVGGDRVQMISGVLHINEKPVPREPMEDFVASDGADRGKPIRRYREALPNGVRHETLDWVDSGFADFSVEFTVPEGHYFTLGDNRDNSFDSRSPRIGFIPAENIRGSAALIVFSVADGVSPWQPWRWLAAVRWSRFFSRVQ